MERNKIRLGGEGSARIRRALPAIAAALVLWSAGPASAAGSPVGPERDRWAGPSRLTERSAEWVSIDGGTGVVGSASSMTVLDAKRSMNPVRELKLEKPATRGVLVGRELYLVERVDGFERLARLHLDSASPRLVEIRLVPALEGEIHLARMDDYLVVTDRRGLRILQLPHPVHDQPTTGHSTHHVSMDPMPVGTLTLEERVTAVTSSLRTVYIATDRGIVTVNASTPRLPFVVRTIPTASRFIQALAANGETLYMMTERGLELLDTNGGGPVRASSFPEVRGGGIYLAGRSLYVATGESGLVSFTDGSSTRATFFIQVGDFFFSPAGIVNVNQGDTIIWQKPSTSFPHNVHSCTPAQSGCNGIGSTEIFSSGAVTTTPFTFQHTFNLVGSNPYVCQAHAFSMQGDITVAAAAASPPGVADGRSGTTPMTVGRLTADGADLQIVYDSAACGTDADDHNILYGDAADFPASLGGTYATAGARCNIGKTSPFTWTASPSVPLAGDLLWWLIVADDGAGKEGSWGLDSAGTERDGTGLNGTSSRCLNSDKDVSNPCPP